MIETIPMPLEPLPGAGATSSAGSTGSTDRAARAGAEPTAHELPITFSGSGSEYFRIWIVNLLLTLVTLGLYFPWAKVRRLRYFYGNTAVGGHTLDFHGEPKRMLRGLLLVGALLLLYSVAGKLSPTAGLIALLIVAGVWPALFRASQQFRMANTSWRGLRFRFNGELRGAYVAMLPLFVPGALTLAAVLFTGDGAAGRARSALETLAGLTALAATLLFPLFLWLLKKYQHDHYALGQIQTELRTGAGSFYGLGLKTFGVAILTAGVAMALATVLGGGGMLALATGGRRGAAAAAAAVAIMLAVVVAYAAVVLVIQPYLTSRFQNLVWGRTASPDVRFDSDLRFWPLLRLTLKNWLLMLVTLGLYWPFAKIAVARMRLQAVTVHTRLAPDEWLGTLRQRADDATGDAAGDLFGIDIGL